MGITNAKKNPGHFSRVIIIAILFFAMLLAYPTSVFACTIQDVCDIDGNCGEVNTCNALCNAINAPSSVVRGTTFSASVIFYNSGTEIWSSANNHKLGSQSPQDNLNWGTNRISLPNSVNRYDFVTFSFTATAPNTAGTYTFAWQMLQEGNMFFGAPCTKQIQVIDPPPLASTCLGISAPSSVSRGSGFSATVTMRNDGNNVWSQSDNYRLGSQSPPDTSRWGLTRVEMPYSASFGNSVTFSINAVAPTDPAATGCSAIADPDSGSATGEHNCPFAWQMTQSGSYFGNTCSTSITVGCVDECSKGSRCNGNYFESCENYYDPDPCLELWRTYCNNGCQVVNGVASCIPACYNECSSPGWYDCVGSTAYYCGQCDADPCYERCSPQTCTNGCTASGCTADPCAKIVCPVRSDTCVDSGGTPVSSSPTLRDYTGNVCNNGICVPAYTDITCQYGCSNGACNNIVCPDALGSCTISTSCNAFNCGGQTWYCRAGLDADGWIQSNDPVSCCSSCSAWCNKKMACGGVEYTCVNEPVDWQICPSGGPNPCDTSTGKCKTPQCNLLWYIPTTSTGEGIRETGTPCIGVPFNVQESMANLKPNTQYQQFNYKSDYSKVVGPSYFTTDSNGVWSHTDTNTPLSSEYVPGGYLSEVIDSDGRLVTTCSPGFIIRACGAENQECCHPTVNVCNDKCGSGLWCHETCQFDPNNYQATAACGHCCQKGWIWDGTKCRDYAECSTSSPAPLNIGPSAPPCTSGQVCCPNQVQTGYGQPEPGCLPTGTGIQPY